MPLSCHFRSTAACVVAIALLLHCGISIARATGDSFTLRGGESRNHEFVVSPEWPLHLRVRQIGIDVVIDVTDHASGQTTTYNSPGERNATEFVVVKRSVPTTLTVTVRPYRVGAPVGQYIVHRYSSDPNDTSTSAIGHLAAAAAHFARENDESDDASIAEYKGLLSDTGAPLRLKALAAFYISAVLARKSAFDEAERYVELARTLFPADNQEMHLAAQRYKAYLSLERGEYSDSYDQSRALLQPLEALTSSQPLLVRDENETRSNACLAILYLREFDRVEDCYEDVIQRGLADGDSFLVGLSHNNMGGLHMMRGETDAAISRFQSAIDYLGGVNATDYMIDSYNNLGIMYRRSGELAKALRSYRISERIHEGSMSLARQATLYNNLGHLQTILGDPQKAADYLRQALALRLSIGNSRRIAITRNNLARTERHLGRYSAAIVLRELALQHYEFDDDIYGQIEVLTALAEDQLAIEESAAAIGTIDRVFELLQQRPNSRQQAAALLAKARVLYGNGNDSRALQFAESADHSYENIRYLPGRLQALQLSATIHNRQDNIDDALEKIRTAIALSQTLQAKVLGMSLGVDFNNSVHDLYIAEADLLLAHADDDPALPYEALLNFERYRELSSQAVTSVKSLISENGAAKSAEMRRLTRKLNTLSDKLARSDDSSEKTNRVRLDYYRTLDQLEQPDEFERSKSLVPFSTKELDTLRAQIPLDTNVVSYLFGEKHVFAWSLSEDRLEFFRLGGTKAIGGKILAVNHAIAARQPNVTDLLFELGKSLVVPLRLPRESENLILVLHGPANLVPFAAIGESSDTYMPLGLRLNIVRSSTLRNALRLSPELNTSDDGSGQIVVIADPVYHASDRRIVRHSSTVDGIGIEHQESSFSSNYDTLQRLPWTSVEAKAIADIYGPEQTTIFTGTGANLTVLQDARVRSASVLHIAAHAIADDTRLDRTGIVLSAYDPDAKPILQFFGIEQLRHSALRPHTVVLSGCETARGAHKHSTGPASIANAFFQSGTRRVVSTLWQISDRATVEFMSEMYTGYASHYSLPAAIRRARQKLQTSALWSDPYFWGAFVAYQQPHSVSQRKEEHN